MSDSNLPDGFADLFPEADRSLEVALPPGEFFVPYGWEKPAFWLSDEPVEPELWVEFRRAHHASGLWPALMLDCPDPILDEEPDPDRWREMSRIGEIDVESLMATGRRWDDEDWASMVFGQGWQGLASSGVLREPADLWAERSVLDGRGEYDPCQLMLIPAERSADAITSIGWNLFNQDLTDPIQISAVLRSWEDRFGARVIYIGDGTLGLSIAAPPATRAEALRVAAEHLVFCGDSITTYPEDFSAHLDHLMSGEVWSFWWD